jgi:hypothetical protein
MKESVKEVKSKSSKVKLEEGKKFDFSNRVEKMLAEVKLENQSESKI